MSGILVLAGLLTPAYWKVVPRDLLKRATSERDSIESKLNYFMLSENPGVVSTMLRTPGLVSTNGVELADGMTTLLGERPLYRLSGGEEPYFERVFNRTFSQKQFDDAFSNIFDNFGIVTNTASLFLSDSLRLKLHGILNQSRNGVVASMLKVRDVKHFKKLTPIGTPKGSALDISVLMTSLMLQSDFFDQSIAQTLQLWAESTVNEKHPRDSEKMEVFLLGVLNLSSRLGYMPLAELTRNFKSPDTVVRSSAIATAFPQYFLTFYSASILHGSPDQLIHYVYHEDKEVSRTRFKALSEALPYGRGGIDFIIRSDKVIVDEHPIIAALPSGIRSLGNLAGLDKFALYQPAAAFISRILFLWGGALSFIALFGYIFRNQGKKSGGSLENEAQTDYNERLGMIRNFLVAFLIGGILWFGSEPGIERPVEMGDKSVSVSSKSQKGSQILLSSTSMNTQTLDQPTVIVLLAFLVIQLILYVICRMKLNEISKSGSEADLKLELLANEENLFDSGLYVGLGGTVMALSMVTLGLVDASLMAAYASTLFGIISVAAVKIFHLRPLRKNLLMEVSRK